VVTNALSKYRREIPEGMKRNDVDSNGTPGININHTI
jgi:hypothetical protein